MIVSSAPTRIDLSGGTLDLWPLYLFFDNAPTLNAAIDLYATVELRPRSDKAVVVESRDLGIRARFAGIDRLPESHPLILPLKLIRFYRPNTGLELITDCQAPAGSGIGGSSALNVALNGALNRFTGRGYRREEMIAIAQNIETTVIRVPAGVQDYYAAMYGGVQAVQPGFVRTESIRIPFDPARLTRHFMLCYTGKPRNSGINNWAVYKQAIDGKKAVRASLEKIAGVTFPMRQMLESGRLDGFARLFDAEWRARKQLAPGIQTPHMAKLITAARRAGAQAAKVCGAGGGGCVAFFLPPDAKARVTGALRRNGGRVLDFRFVSRGLQVRRRSS